MTMAPIIESGMAFGPYEVRCQMSDVGGRRSEDGEKGHRGRRANG